MDGLNGEETPEKIETEKVSIVREKGLGYTLTIERENLKQVALGLSESGFDLFQFVSATDFPDSIKLIYRIYSTKIKNKVSIFIKTELPKSDPVVDSVVSIWPAANWHEREMYDLFGVKFKGHPDLRRLFMPEDWVGYPLRKDYVDDQLVRKPNNS